MLKGRIHSTESFGTVDGPGIRFVIFLQGCPMRCAYCHNPDTWEINGGRERLVSELLEEYDSYKEFLKGGGITVTGGEPLLQLDFVTELFTEAKKRGIHTCIDTSGITYREENSKAYDKLLKVTDLVMLDIKQMDREKHKQLTGHYNDHILQFASYLSNYNKALWIRYVAVPGITDDTKDLEELGRFLAGLTSLKALDVLPYHTMGVTKYENMKLEYPIRNIPPMEKDEAKRVRNIILNSRMKKLKENNCKT